MDQSRRYADILTQVLREKSKLSFRTIPRLKIVSSCDTEAGQFLLIMIGWDNQKHWVHSILFHAQVIDSNVIIESDMTEDGLTSALCEAGISFEHILSGEDRDWLMATPQAKAA